jgi:hypothetical protein
MCWPDQGMTKGAKSIVTNLNVALKGIEQPPINNAPYTDFVHSPIFLCS